MFTGLYHQHVFITGTFLMLHTCYNVIFYTVVMPACWHLMPNVHLTQVYRNKPVEGDRHSLGENVMVLTFMHSLHLVNQSAGLVAQGVCQMPLCSCPEDHHMRGRQDPTLCIWLDATPYTRACVGEPHQFAL